jgi:putative lipoprotein
LVNTYWRINSMLGDQVIAKDGQREPHLSLKAADQKSSYAATVGCNQLVGSYSLNGDTIVFQRGAATLMACPPPLDALEKSLVDVLTRTKRWLVTGNTLELRDEQGSQIALFEAVYF